MMALQSMPPELVTEIVQQGGSVAAAVAILWWRLNQLEDRVDGHLDDLEEKIEQNEARIYNRLHRAHEQAGEKPPPPPKHPLNGQDDDEEAS